MCPFAAVVPAHLVALVISCAIAGPALSATIAVTGAGDTIAVDGVATLREAITSINNGASVNADVIAAGAYGTADTINFNMSSGFHVIDVIGSSLPVIVKPVVIDGQTQPGSVVNSAATGDNSTHNIMINCSSANSCINGLTLGAGSAGSTLRFLILDSAPGSGLLVNSANNVIAGNWIGLDSTGVGAAAPNGTGITMTATGPAQSIAGNTIGGPNAADRNVISGNTTRDMLIGSFDSGGFGASANIIVQNNYIGPNKTGAVALSPGQGIQMTDLLNATIGGTSSALGGSCAGVCNLISGRSGGVGIQVTGATSDGTRIEGNFFGTDVTGTVAMPNGSVANIQISASHAVTVGGTIDGRGNLISGESGSGAGILVDGGVVGPVDIHGNFIGTTTSGNAALGNGGPGIRVVGSVNVNIGMGPVGRNVIGGNGNGTSPKGPGILMEGNLPFSTASAVFQNNYIGVGVDGTTNVGNLGDGIDFSLGATGSIVGVASIFGGNVIAFNGAGRTNGAGIGVQNGSSGNRIFDNSIFGNTGSSTGLGIDLSATAQVTDGNTANDNCDPDSGGNALLNFPVLTFAGGDGVNFTVQGNYNGAANQAYTIEFFYNPAATPSQGQRYLGSLVTNTNGSCAATFVFNYFLVVTLFPGDTITAKAIDSLNNTSEFSAPITGNTPVTLQHFEIE